MLLYEHIICTIINTIAALNVTILYPLLYILPSRWQSLIESRICAIWKKQTVKFQKREISLASDFFLPFLRYHVRVFRFSILSSNINNRAFVPSSRSFTLLWEYRMNETCLPGIYDSPMLRAFYFTATWRSTVSHDSAVNSQRYLNWRCMAFNMIMTSVLYGCSCTSENRHFPADVVGNRRLVSKERALERINTNACRTRRKLSDISNILRSSAVLE